MPAFKNVSGSLRILPGGEEIPPGETFDFSDDDLKNKGVEYWMNEGDFELDENSPSIAANTTERLTLLRAAASELNDSDFTASGMPKVGKINELIDAESKFTAPEIEELLKDQ